MSCVLVSFTLEDQRYALYLSAVQRVVRAVAITLLPEAPGIVLGVINVQGRVTAVVDIRKRFGLPPRELALSDHLIIARTSARSLALVVDEATGVIDCPEEFFVPVREILSGTRYVEGLVKLPDGMILIHDLEKFLSLEEQHSLDKAMQQV